jgi:hypothetical protein
LYLPECFGFLGHLLLHPIAFCKQRLPLFPHFFHLLPATEGAAFFRLRGAALAQQALLRSTI